MIIAVTGRPGSGKDTIARYLVTKYDFRQFELKMRIEEVVYAMFRIPMTIIRNRELREIPLEQAGFSPHALDCKEWTVRKLLQWVGQTYRDTFGQDVWPASLWEDIRRFWSRDGRLMDISRVVISDVRTPRDATFFKERMMEEGDKFKLILVSRPGHGSTTSGGFKNHPLESHDLTSLADATIENDGTIQELLAKIDVCLRS